MNITLEQGKTLKGAQGDVLRGLGQYLLMFPVALIPYVLRRLVVACSLVVEIDLIAYYSYRGC